LQERIQNSPHLRYVVGRASPSASSIALIEQKAAPTFSDFIDGKPQLGSRFAHMACNERYEPDHEQWNAKLSRERLRCHPLARTRWSREKNASVRNLPVFAQPVAMGLLPDCIIDSLPKPRIEDNVIWDVARLPEFNNAF